MVMEVVQWESGMVLHQHVKVLSKIRFFIHPTFSCKEQGNNTNACDYM